MSLVIIESPNKIKKLKTILGSSFEVMATVGHFQKLSKKDLGFDHGTFEPNYVLDRTKSDLIKNIVSEAKKHDHIFIATDPDREGEAIAKHIHDRLPKKGKVIKRVKFNAITKDSVKKAMKNPTDIDMNLYMSQTARRLTDRIVGYMVSPVLWKKGLANTSAGRVQSVALKYISDLEKRVKDFKPETFWRIDCQFKEGYSANLVKIGSKSVDKLDKNTAIDSEKNLKAATYTVSSVLSKKRKVSPKPPFITSTLQQDASSRFNWPSKRTMSVAQNLFGAGLITYHRTDSIRVESEKITSLRDKVEKVYGKNYLSPNTRVWANKSAAQDAHEAIRPTFESAPTNMLPDEKKLLKLIIDRFKASQMSDAEIEKTTISIEAVNGKLKYTLQVSGDVVTFDGFSKVYGNKKDDVFLPATKKAATLNLVKVNNKSHQTKAPPRFTDASLVKKLEKEGVGRPSTYASIIDTLENRKYIERERKSLKATEVGIMISDYLSSNFASLISTDFTKKMEKTLDGMAAGDVKYVPVMKTFHKNIKDSVQSAVNLPLPKSFIVDDECPKCTSKMIKKISKHGPFLACTSWPKCNGTRNIDGTDNKIEVETGKPCDKCGNIMIKRKGKNGDFWGCKSFPICKNTEVIFAEGEEKVSCDKCGDGFMIKRKGKYGFFFGCSSYPKCKNIKKVIKSNKSV
jgi:DNA topoisomerase I